MKTLLVAFGAATMLLAPVTTTFARADARDLRQTYAHWRDRVSANGRCDGVSYGTGARSCGTATGGPVGGLSSRN